MAHIAADIDDIAIRQAIAHGFDFGTIFPAFHVFFAQWTVRVIGVLEHRDLGVIDRNPAAATAREVL